MRVLHLAVQLVNAFGPAVPVDARIPLKTIGDSMTFRGCLVPKLGTSDRPATIRIGQGRTIPAL
ncbi:hypothetical protein [Marimonas arenosa]|uniref:Uncharacterized protein n=1 Tax=Marimonas arenosa TaxID=1795305 RepID=A0AAE3WFU4_9RHOB|nr:hypothetical protein [Marimonas arenosa]MDQ2090917.1 hypothetical protein [Marimonas arenosa]